MYDEKAFMKRFDKAKSRKSNWDSILTVTYDLFLPNRQTIIKQTRGQVKQTNVYDNTGVNELGKFANQLKHSLLPSHREWAQLKPSPQVDSEVSLGITTAEERDELARTLGVLNTEMFRQIWNSNFDTAVHEAIQDMAISTGALLVLDSGNVSNPLNFVSVPANELYPEAGANGTIETVFREHSIPVRDVYSLFPKADADELLDKMIAKDGSTPITVVEGTLWNDEKKEYNYCVKIDSAKRKIFFEDVYDVSPWIIFRSNVAPGETLGRGPAIDALPSMQTLNKLSEQLLYNNDMAINPPMVVDYAAGGLDISNVNIHPGSLLPSDTSSLSSGVPYQFLQTGANFNVGLAGKQDLQNQVKEPFNMVNLGNVGDANMTATEAQIRNAQALSQQAAMFGRLNTELVQKLIKRVFYILGQYNSNFPRGFTENDAISISASSPLAMVQSQADLESTLQYLQLSMSMGEMGQAMFASVINTGEMGNYLAEKMGVPASLMLSANERKQLSEQVNAQVQSQINNQQQQQQQGPM